MTRAENKHLFPDPPVPAPLVPLFPPLCAPHPFGTDREAERCAQPHHLYGHPFTNPSLSTGSTPALFAPPTPFPRPSPLSLRRRRCLQPRMGYARRPLAPEVQENSARFPLLVYTPRPALRALLSRQRRRGCGPRSPSRPGSRAPPSRNAANTGERENDGAARKWGARTRGSRTARQRARGPSREGEMRGLQRGNGRAEEGSGKVRGGGGVPPHSLKGVSGASCNPGGGRAETEARAHLFRTFAPIDRLRQNTCILV